MQNFIVSEKRRSASALWSVMNEHLPIFILLFVLCVCFSFGACLTSFLFCSKYDVAMKCWLQCDSRVPWDENSFLTCARCSLYRLTITLTITHTHLQKNKTKTKQNEIERHTHSEKRKNHEKRWYTKKMRTETSNATSSQTTTIRTRKKIEMSLGYDMTELLSTFSVLPLSSLSGWFVMLISSFSRQLRIQPQSKENKIKLNSKLCVQCTWIFSQKLSSLEFACNSHLSPACDNFFEFACKEEISLHLPEIMILHFVF